jgi:hypothetical protein
MSETTISEMDAWAARMLADPETKTPQTDPDHHTVGHRFRAWDGRIYLCVWYNRRAGYQMESDDDGPRRVANVSERAIGATYHEVP